MLIILQEELMFIFKKTLWMELIMFILYTKVEI